MVNTVIVVLAITPLVTACSDSPAPAVTVDACVAPMPSGCVPHGLAAVALAGDWTLTGTVTDDHCGLSMTTTTPISTQVGFVVDGCLFGMAGGAVDGMRGDTSAQVFVPALQGANAGDSISVCMNDAGMIAYTDSAQYRCVPTSANPDYRVTTGTLTR